MKRFTDQTPRALIIDIQGTDPANFPDRNVKTYLEKIKREDKPVLLALTVYQRENWRGSEELFHTIASRQGSGLLLEGVLHTCMHRNHRICDPHHEAICIRPRAKSASAQQQADLIGQGADFLKGFFGISPIGLLPPQHLWNADTVQAVQQQQGMKYLITNAMFSDMFPYEESGIVVVPSGSAKHGRIDNPVVHFYYDKIQQQEEMFRTMLTRAIPLKAVWPDRETLKHKANQLYIRAAKQARDLRRFTTCLGNGFRPLQDTYLLRAERKTQYQKASEEIRNLNLQ